MVAPTTAFNEFYEILQSGGGSIFEANIFVVKGMKRCFYHKRHWIYKCQILNSCQSGLLGTSFTSTTLSYQGPPNSTAALDQEGV